MGCSKPEEILILAQAWACAASTGPAGWDLKTYTTAGIWRKMDQNSNTEASRSFCGDLDAIG